MGRLRRRLPSHGTVAAYIALFVALATGGAYAAEKIGSADIAKNAVKSKHIKNEQVKRKDIRDNAVNSAKVEDASLLGEDFAPGQLPQGPPGAPGESATDLWAVVDDDGTLRRGSHVVASRVISVSQAQYEVVFDRNVRECAYVATLGPGVEFFDALGEIEVALRGGSGNTVAVRTANSSGSASQRFFHLVVHC
jgi:hypothetical protein